ncbi:hypothetical protein DPMN_065832 [Dreissena polymorpha]|uniref:Uncharacterized protein n=1 Tax=Dreissena polymorpha TaxID=45954 RepID=A0A9D3YWL9_DREPO|nr:hypothetical protein DPMN_065832 [Dreissena polymorpha]
MQESTAEIPTCWGFTLEENLEELQVEQSKDKDLTIIIEWLLKGKEPDEGISRQSRSQVLLGEYSIIVKILSSGRGLYLPPPEW